MWIDPTCIAPAFFKRTTTHWVRSVFAGTVMGPNVATYDPGGGVASTPPPSPLLLLPLLLAPLLLAPLLLAPLLVPPLAPLLVPPLLAPLLPLLDPSPPGVDEDEPPHARKPPRRSATGRKI